MQRPSPDSLPLTPGVYLYKDAQGRILYVGKARILRRRVLSYFREEGLPAKTVAMLRHAERLETLSTTTEKEALLLEASLIKKHRPRYNIVLRDDKQYVLFRLAVRHPFPRLEIVRAARRDGARYFGPFTSATAARETWKLIHKAFPLRRCTDRAMRNRVRPCLYHHIGQCPAPCMAAVTPAEYNEGVRKVTELLSGRSSALLLALERDMLAASEALEFERAALLRDQLQAVRRTVERQAAVLPGGGDRDVVGLYAAENGLGLGILFVRGGLVIDGRAFFWPGLTFDDAPELLWSFPTQFYGPVTPPPRIILPWLPAAGEEEGAAAGSGAGTDAIRGQDAPASVTENAPAFVTENAPASFAEDATASFAEDATASVAASPPASIEEHADSGGGERAMSRTAEREGQDASTDSLEALEQTLSDLRGGPVHITAPRNAEENGLVDMAAANAREEARRRRETPLEERLAQALHVREPVRRVECVDVSHTSGQQTRVGLVVFEDGRPLASAYRQYAMAEGGSDDYGVLAAWTARRLQSGPPWPDVLLIDGGKGQLAAVGRALTEAGQEGLFALASIAKARNERGQADRRAGNVSDRIFLPGRANPLPLREGAPELLFLQHVRDTAHRFAIGSHRRARAGAALSGELMRVPGVGPHTARLLWDHFGSVERMAAATAEELEAVPGIGKTRAKLLAEKLRLLAAGGPPH